MNNVLVLGGTGFLGRSVCEAIVEHTGGGDARIVVPTRHIGRAGDLWTLPTLEVEQADVHDDAQLQRLVRGRDAVVNLVGILHGSEPQFRRVHVDLPQRLVRACAAAGVPRIVHVSALGASASAPSKYLRSKAAGEAALRHPAVAAMVLRPSVMFGAHDRFINRFAQLQRRFPLLPLACADARFQPVWVCNVAAAIVRAIDTAPPPAETIECVGPKVYTLRELVELAGRWSGHTRRIVALPPGLARLQATLFEALPGEPLVSRDNLESMKVDNVASGELPGLERFGIAPQSLESVMEPLLMHRVGPDHLQPLRAVARRH